MMLFVCIACSSHLPPEFWLQGPDQGPERQKQMEAGQQNMDEKTQWNKSLMGLRAAHVVGQGDSNVPAQLSTRFESLLWPRRHGNCPNKSLHCKQPVVLVLFLETMPSPETLGSGSFKSPYSSFPKDLGPRGPIRARPSGPFPYSWAAGSQCCPQENNSLSIPCTDPTVCYS